MCGCGGISEWLRYSYAPHLKTETKYIVCDPLVASKEYRLEKHKLSNEKTEVSETHTHTNLCETCRIINNVFEWHIHSMNILVLGSSSTP